MEQKDYTFKEIPKNIQSDLTKQGKKIIRWDIQKAILVKKDFDGKPHIRLSEDIIDIQIRRIR